MEFNDSKQLEIDYLTELNVVWNNVSTWPHRQNRVREFKIQECLIPVKWQYCKDEVLIDDISANK